MDGSFVQIVSSDVFIEVVSGKEQKLRTVSSKGRTRFPEHRLENAVYFDSQVESESKGTEKRQFNSHLTKQDKFAIEMGAIEKA